ncbi:MarR family transcriptional regulator [Enterococcus sp. MSG2901]|uniref:MarR family transcriptional regulator n=2 Tax=Candidatus Enterococcus courvalinii TaxID=2815329 RepID=A0ABS3HW96_9ENTE|nr:MarR family transcriptional regulator [Enterococcus sp. MSG2901]
MTQIQKRPINITEDLKLSTSMIHLIEMIGNYPDSTITDLAERLGVTKGAISQQIPTLRKMNLITVTQTKVNKKNKLISLTDQGKQVYNSHNSLHKELYDSIQEAMATFSAEQLITIMEILKKVSFNIKEYQAKLSGKD